MTTTVSVLLVGGPTTVIEIGGVRLLTDPTFDPPGDYPTGERKLTKLTPPAVPVEAIGPVDAVLLSHDQHADNLDHSGRELLKDVPLVLTTGEGAPRVGGQVLPNWERTTVGAVTVTGVPAQHGPDGTTHLTGEVTGFVLSGDGLPTVYVSGDNASLDVVRSISSRIGPIDHAVLFAGCARTALIDGPLTLTAGDAAEAARILGVRTVVPVHAEGWAHFTENVDDLVASYASASLSDVLSVIRPGETAVLR
jgi:L-ascorbate metabolism protein UlaG (beta-lactamase superfamily)